MACQLTSGCMSTLHNDFPYENLQPKVDVSLLPVSSLRKIGWSHVEWISQAEDRDHWRAVVSRKEP
jgi:hypothetical protein